MPCFVTRRTINPLMTHKYLPMLDCPDLKSLCNTTECIAGFLCIVAWAFGNWLHCILDAAGTWNLAGPAC